MNVGELLGPETDSINRITQTKHTRLFQPYGKYTEQMNMNGEEWKEDLVHDRHVFWSLHAARVCRQASLRRL